jgi:hypothetical protein
MRRIKIEITIFDKRWDTIAKDSAIIPTVKEGLLKKFSSCACNLLIDMVGKIKDNAENKEKNEDDFRRSQGCSDIKKKEKEDKDSS